jgi:protein-disulfide isomerase
MKRAAVAFLMGLAMALGLGVGLAAASTRRPVPDPDPVAGNSNAKIRVIIYQDLECPDCAQWHGVFVHQIIPEFGKQVAFEFRDFPLPQHLWSFNAAVLARYFDQKSLALGLAWRDYCFTHQNDITPDNLISRAAAWAAPHGITRAQLDLAFTRTDLFALVQADMQRGRADHVEHTPTVLLNGVEATSPTELEQWLRLALARQR